MKHEYYPEKNAFSFFGEDFQWAGYGILLGISK